MIFSVSKNLVWHALFCVNEIKATNKWNYVKKRTCERALTT